MTARPSLRLMGTPVQLNNWRPLKLTLSKHFFACDRDGELF